MVRENFKANIYFSPYCFYTNKTCTWQTSNRKLTKPYATDYIQEITICKCWRTYIIFEKYLYILFSCLLESNPLQICASAFSNSGITVDICFLECAWALAAMRSFISQCGHSITNKHPMCEQVHSRELIIGSQLQHFLRIASGKRPIFQHNWPSDRYLRFTSS